MTAHDLLPGVDHARRKLPNGLGARRYVHCRIRPKPDQSLRVRRLQFRRGTPFPLTKTDLLQAWIERKRQTALRSEFFGECSTTTKGRRNNSCPLHRCAGCFAHLAPTFVAQRIIGLATIAAPTLGFAVAQKIDQGLTHRHVQDLLRKRRGLQAVPTVNPHQRRASRRSRPRNGRRSSGSQSRARRA